MKRLKNRIKIKKKYLFFIGIILLLIILFFATKLYLYFKFLIGNDFVISLNADKTNFFLNHGDQDKVILKSQVYSNIFCSSSCSSKFIDLGTGKILDEQEFILKSTGQNVQEYNLFADKIGKGQSLYRFEIRCANIKTTFCQTDGEQKSKKILITLDYDLNKNEKELKLEFIKNISSTIQNLSYISENLLELNNLSLELNNFNNSNNFSSEFEELSKSINLLNETIFNMKKILEEDNYSFLENEMPIFEENLKVVKGKFETFNETIYNLTLGNNRLFENFSYAQQRLKEFKIKNVSFNETLEINSLINEFNEIINNRESYYLIYDFISKLDNFNFTGQTCCFASEMINDFNLSKIYLYEINNNFSINFSESEPKCCFFGNCNACDSNSNNSKYPIIFVHGHSFNHKISAEYSFDTFEKLQEKLEQENYINAGTIISTSGKAGVLGRANYPFSFVSSYYFDIYKNDLSTKIVQTKGDSIDTYAIRLNDIVKEVKSETDKDKVIIIAHSMGGLVSRRYLQIFGEEDVEKFIMLGTPNHGISKKIYDYCKLFGSNRECEDMNSDSLLINKLNQDVLEIPVYNIIGLGCDMNGEDGDGIVENKTAYLNFAENYYISGICPGTFDFLHLRMVEPEQYPEVYEIIKSALKE